VSEPLATVGVIGLGVMGGRAAAALVAAGHTVLGHDIDAAARTRATAAGVQVVDGAARTGREASVVLLSLPMPADVLSVVDELAPACAGTLVVDLSTIDPATSRAAADRITRHGGRFVDAPVLGRPAGVGSWTLAAGGNDVDVADVARIAVGTIAKAVEPVGAVGAGSTVKILNNLMFGAINSVTAEVLDLAERAGMSSSRFTEVVAGSGAATASPLFRDVAPRMATGEHTPVFSLALLHKDVRLGVALAAELGAPAEISTAVEALTGGAIGLGHAAEDTSALIELYRTRRATA
jgi:3-hydroxyisobutyrate dehydrogenase